ncbi:MAG: membrane-bound PQQ-dependent dehydrogenase, glucose/quinate/shikimate family [Rhodanobacteraceae bacterium]
MFAILTGYFLAIFGALLLAGGIWLALLGGTLAYIGLGAGWMISGILLILRRRAALGVYALLLILTLIWAWFEVGLDRWALLPRYALFSLLGLWLLMPWIDWALRPGPERLRARGWFGARGALAVTVLLALVLGLVSLGRDPFGIGGSLPRTAAANAATPTATAAPGANWTAYGGNGYGERYSSLKQVTTGNVHELKLAWTYHTGETKTGPNDPDESTSEDTPLEIGGTLYVCTTHDHIVALDAATGKQLWNYDPHVQYSHDNQHLTCRGLGYHSATVPAPVASAVVASVPAASASSMAAAPAPSASAAIAAAAPAPASSVAMAATPNGMCAARLVLATIDARLIEVDAKTGKPCADFGQDGQVNLAVNMGTIKPGYYMETSPPLVTSKLIVVGASINDNNSVHNPSGVIRAFDVDSGRLVWNWDMGKPDPNAPLKPGEQYTPNTPPAWAPLSADEKLGMVYVPLGNQSPDELDIDRSPAVEKYSASVVALSLADGRMVWSFQGVHYDMWDRDMPAQPTLVDLTIDGASVPALVQPTKQGDVYVLNRRTGKPILPVTQVSVSTKTDMHDIRVSPVQPKSSLSFMPRRLTGADMWGASPFDQLWCRIQFKSMIYEGPYTPNSTHKTIAYPGQLGVFDWGGVAVDPVRQVMVGTPVHMAYVFQMIPRPPSHANVVTKGKKEHFNENYGAPYAVVLKPFLSPFSVACQQPPWGGIAGANLRTGKITWMHRNGTTRDRGTIHIPFEMGVPGFGGPLITAGGVVFYSGAIDDYLRAYDETTGQQLWQVRLPAGGQATPMTYSVDGQQYIVVMAGGHGSAHTPLGDSVVAYALPNRR